jgi:hypothetical protein
MSLDTASPLETFVKRDKELGSGCSTMTDHGTLAGAMDFYEFAKKKEISPIIGCLMPGQEIHTINGIKKIENIVVGDEVLTHKGHYRKVLSTMTRSYNGEVVDLFVGRNGARPLTLTVEHPVLISNNQGETKWIRADQLNPGRLNSQGGTSNHKEYVVLPKLRGNGNNVIDILPFFIDYPLFSVNSNSISKTDISGGKDGGSREWFNFGRYLTLDGDLARFLGLFCAEGSASDSGTCTLTFNKNEDEYIDFCHDFLFSRFGIVVHSRIREERGTSESWFCNRPFAIILRALIGVGASNKKVPSEILKCSDVSIKNAFFQGLLEGDGKKGDRNTLKLSSESCVWNARLLAAESNAFLVPHFRNDGGHKSWTIEFQTDYEWRRSLNFENFIAMPLGKTTRRPYSGPVFNFEVEEDNSYVSDFALHNCEAYLFDPNCPITTAGGIEDAKAYNKYYHLTMHCMDEPAYKALVKKLSTADRYNSVWAGSEKKPLFTWADLEELSAYNFTYCSSCLAGVVSNHLKNDRPDLATKYYEKIRSLVKPGRFYVEVFPHSTTEYWTDGVFVEYADGTKDQFRPTKKLRVNGVELTAADLPRMVGKSLQATRHRTTWTEIEPKIIRAASAIKGFVRNECTPFAPDGDLQLACNKFLIELAESHGDKVIVSLDSHYATQDYKDVQTIKLTQQGWGPFFGSYHIYSSDEAYVYFKSKMGINEATYGKWIDNSYEWSSLFKDFKMTKENLLPRTRYPADTEAHLRQLIKDHGRFDGSEAWTARVETEIALFKKNGTIDLLPYFFTGEDFCNAHEKEKILLGPGRGCFLPTSPVLLADGSSKEIQEIKVGDIVVSHDNSTNPVEALLVYDVNEEMVEIECEDGRLIKCTKDHKILTRRGWVMAINLTLEDDIIEVGV